ncbi:type II toxin-antitoxin system RelE/ParE family toxin [Xanthomonas sp. LMG 9002]|uniref:type II toxin-antitoxin system RelE/ParE family toxin n=1 Tax=Xanthomonas sp. LMG 9002 TaxID=1591158 RepID=UPI00136873AD|nr:type II toxin-antitoxin system RelE/ParE family toxin [Xanthomonas sp. LMG 9002]MXV07973.1 type II toxin-antitoxin system RelE/ParE family toxin [Xanthomonas sp. LMG 9002]
MSRASHRAPVAAETRSERWQRWIAWVLSALLHVLMALALLYAAKPTMSTPQGAAGGSRIRVDFLGESDKPAKPLPPKPTPPPASATPKRRHATTTVQSTLVAQSDDPVPPPDRADTPKAADTPRTAPAPSPAQTADSNPPPPTERRPQTWTGRPPGALDTDTAPDNSGLAAGPGSRGNRHDMDAAQPSLEVGGYLVYYDLGSESQLRAWQQQGMKELFILLPGTEYRMVCPLEIALTRGSGKCRALPPDSPELKGIGDARQVITMLQVYHQGELVWRGPGPYR